MTALEKLLESNHEKIGHAVGIVYTILFASIFISGIAPFNFLSFMVGMSLCSYISWIASVSRLKSFHAFNKSWEGYQKEIAPFHQLVRDIEKGKYMVVPGPNYDASEPEEKKDSVH